MKRKGKESGPHANLSKKEYWRRQKVAAASSASRPRLLSCDTMFDLDDNIRCCQLQISAFRATGESAARLSAMLFNLTAYLAPYLTQSRDKAKSCVMVRKTPRRMGADRVRPITTLFREPESPVCVDPSWSIRMPGNRGQVLPAIWHF
jgi:hypothetical protein